MRVPPVFIVSAGVLLLFACSYLPLSPPAPAGVVWTSTKDYIEIRPSENRESPLGLLYYPGGFVDPHAYIPPLAEFSRRGYVVVILKVAANLAVLDIDKALGFTNRFTGVTSWVVGGHSLGGVSAAFLVKDSPERFRGLVLQAAYTSDQAGLQDWHGAVLSISASNDGLSTPAKIEAARHLLPTHTRYHEIYGGCHAFFGAYGPQAGDGIPLITAEEQYAESADQIEAFFESTGALE